MTKTGSGHPCPEVTPQVVIPRRHVDLKGVLAIALTSKGTEIPWQNRLLTKMITGFGQKNALPKLGMAVPVMVHYRFGS